MANTDGSVISGMIWMLVISILLFWLPVLGPLVAGVVGGMKSGGVGKALMAVFLPAVLIGVVATLLPTIAGTVHGLPLVGIGFNRVGKGVDTG